MASDGSILNKHKIEDRNTKEAVRAVEQLANEGKKGNFVIKDAISKSDTGKLDEGVRYIDKKNKRTVVKIDGQLYYSNLTELT